MFDALPPPPNYRPAPRWGLIIVTGIVAAAVVIFGGLLVARIVGGDDRSEASTPPSATVPPQAVLALEIPHEGRWTIRVFVEAPAGVMQRFDNTGTGYFVVPPQIETRFDSRLRTEIEYQIFFTLPQESRVEIENYATQAEYFNALAQTFYAIYDADHQFLGIRNQAVVASLARQGDFQIVVAED
jgi:hypothetical protein